MGISKKGPIKLFIGVLIITAILIPLLIQRILMWHILVHNHGFRDEHWSTVAWIAMFPLLYFLIIFIIIILFGYILRKRKYPRLQDITERSSVDLKIPQVDPEVSDLMKRTERILLSNLKIIKGLKFLILFMIGISFLPALFRFLSFRILEHDPGLRWYAFVTVYHLTIWFIPFIIILLILFPHQTWKWRSWTSNLKQWRELVAAELKGGSTKISRIEVMIRMIDNMELWLKEIRNFQILTYSLIGLFISQTVPYILGLLDHFGIIEIPFLLYEIIGWIILVLIVFMCWAIPNLQYDKKMEYWSPRIKEFRRKSDEFIS